MKAVRVPIALRFFVLIALAMLVITTVGLVSQHYHMQRNFARYVADVEMQKLDQLIVNLQGIYDDYGSWSDAIQEQIFMIEGQAEASDYDQLSRWWLRRQYDIALQQQIFKEKRSQFISGKSVELMPNGEPLTAQHLQQWNENLPSAYAPFSGLSFPLSKSEKWLQVLDPERFRPLIIPETREIMQRAERIVGVERKDKPFISIPDKLGLSSRLVLYDAMRQFVVGDSLPTGDILYRTLYNSQGQVIGYLGLKASLKEGDAKSINFFQNQQKYLWLIYVISMIASVAIALLLAMYFRQPIRQLWQATQELMQGNYQHQVVVQRNDELGDLSQAVNQLATILHQHEQSRRQWVADTSHELKTPLAVLQAQIEALQDGIRPPSQHHFDAMQRQVQSLKKLTQDLSDLAQADVQQLKCYPSEYAVWAVVEQEVAYFQPQFEQAQLQVSIEGVEACVWLDIDRFRQIVVNLLQNTIRYTLAGGQVHIHSHIEQSDWVLYIDDSPLALTDEQLSRLGQRFYRVDSSRTRLTGGSGLGLALSCQIAQLLGGTLSFDHSPLGGLRCILRLPCVPQEKT